MLGHRMQDKDTVRLMILRLFPGIRGLASDKDLHYYRWMLDIYFATARGLPSQTEIECVIKVAIGDRLYVMVLISGVAPAMRTAEGRRLVIAVIKDRRDYLGSREYTSTIIRCEMRRLENIIVAIRTNFIVNANQITAHYYWRLD